MPNALGTYLENLIVLQRLGAQNQPVVELLCGMGPRSATLTGRKGDELTATRMEARSHRGGDRSGSSSSSSDRRGGGRCSRGSFGSSSSSGCHPHGKGTTWLAT